jgi:AbrB family looped-hinge helix DNA binding protein
MARARTSVRGERATITTKGQVTIPKAIREQLALEVGTKLHFWVDPTGRIVVTPLTVKLEDLIGILPKPEVPVTVEEMNEAIVQAAVERATRGL